MASSSTSSLDDVLLGATPAMTRQIQQSILDRGGLLDDPAWVPFAAALRVKLETQALIPEAVSGVIERTSSEALGRITSAVASQVSKAIHDVARAASRSSPINRSARRMQLISAMAGGIAALSVLGVGIWIGRGLFAGLPESTSGSFVVQGASKQDGAILAQWALSIGATDPLVRARVDRFLSAVPATSDDKAMTEWALTAVGRYAQRFLSANEFLYRGECPNSGTEHRSGRRTCVVWYVDPDGH